MVSLQRNPLLQLHFTIDINARFLYFHLVSGYNKASLTLLFQKLIEQHLIGQLSRKKRKDVPYPSSWQRTANDFAILLLSVLASTR